ncbi:DMT family transporter [Halorarius litoreus]|uniref:DMT family transporter n=1 Tax=Halorarius litoreus TaxID=2962676 RepID=UPI0020CFA422|nr:DMT family transporter [Halorarius litoreus]
MDDEHVGVLLVFVSAAGFGTFATLGALADAAGLSRPTVLLFRFGLATLLVWTVLGVRGELTRLRGRNLAVGLGLGAFGYAAISYLYLLGLEYMTAGLVGIVLYTYPAFVVVIAALVLDESVTRLTGLALVLALGGVALITGADPAAADPRGIAVMLAAALLYAGYITVSRTTLGDVRPRTLSAHVMPAAAVVFLVVTTTTDSLTLPANAYEWGLVTGIAVLATAIPIFAFFAGLERLGASRTSILSTLEPVVTVALGVAVLDERLTVATVAGGVLVLAGVLLVQRR